MELRRLVRSPWVVAALGFVPMVVVPLTVVGMLVLLKPTPAKTIAIPKDLPEQFPLEEKLRAQDLTVLTSATPQAELDAGRVDGAIFGVVAAPGGRWEAQVAGAGGERVEEALQDAGDHALGLAVGPRGPSVRLPKLSARPEVPKEGLDLPKGSVAAYLAFAPIWALLYALVPLAAADRASGLYETLAVLRLRRWEPVLARVVAATVVAFGGAALFFAAVVALIGGTTLLEPHPSDILRVVLAQALMTASLLWTGEVAPTPVLAMQSAGSVLMVQMALLGLGIAMGQAWIPLGGIFVAEGVLGWLAGVASTVGATAAIVALCVRARGAAR